MQEQMHVGIIACRLFPPEWRPLCGEHFQATGADCLATIVLYWQEDKTIKATVHHSVGAHPGAIFLPFV